MAHTIPTIHDDQIIGEQTDPIVVGTSAWFDWLDQATSFAFRGASGTFTARKEYYQRGGGYWRAYRKHKGRLQRIYLGKSQRLTYDRLIMAAVALANPDRKASRGQEHTDYLHPNQRPPTMVQRHDQLPAQSFVATKLLIPSVRDTLVDRTTLVQQLDLSRQHALTVINAPAGYGKTTLLRQWCNASIKRGHPVVWVSLDAHDNDPTRFWSYVAQAFQLAYAGIAEHMLAILQVSYQPQLELVVTILINALMTIPHDVTLVLDDYHVITETTLHTSIMCLLDQLPPHLHIIVSSRSELPLPIARLRAQGTLLEIQTADLSFSFAESRTFLTSARDLKLNRVDIETLHKRTEGWAAGLQIAAMALRAHAQPQQFIATFTGSHRHLVDYFANEVLSQQPDSTQLFMVETSVLDRLTGPLCNALTGREDSALLLEELWRTNIFLVALDDQGQWYQYHPLFVAFLRNRLDRMFPTRVPRLHRAASQWFATQGLIVDAIYHALVASAYQEAADIIVKHAPEFFRQGEIMTLLNWCKHFPETYIQEHLQLCLVYARAAVLTGQLEIVAARLHDIDQQSHQIDALPLALQQELWTLRALLASLAGNLSEAAIWTQRALELNHFNDTSLQSVLFMSISASAWRKGDLIMAYQMFDKIIAVNQKSPEPHLIFLAHSHQAQIQAQRSQIRAAIAQCHYVLDRADEPNMYHLLAVGMASACLGRLLYERNELGRATSYLHQGIDYGQRWHNADLVITSAVYLARIAQADGDDRQARAWFHEAAQFVNNHNPSVWAITDFTACQIWLSIVQNNMTDAAAWADQHEPGVMDDQQSLSMQEQLTFAWVRIAQGYACSIEPLLRRLQQAAIDKGMTNQTIAIAIVEALALQSQGETDRAVDVLDNVITLAETEGYIRSFVDAGTPMRILLDQLAKKTSRSAYVHRVLGAYHQKPSQKQVHTSEQPEPLSDREHEVLRLVAHGQSNQEIAQTLVVTVSTVKKHLSTIFAKLHVRNRTQAVIRAQELLIL